MVLNILVLAGIIFVVLTVMSCRHIFRRYGLKGLLPVLALRFGAVSVLAYLVWLIFWSYEKHEDPESDERDRKRVLVLQDVSESMNFPSGAGTRAELAEQVWTQCRRMAEKQKRPPELQRILFAANIAEEEQRDRIRPDASQLGTALAGALSRYEMDAMIIVSDGSTTDGMPAKYVRDWIRNRGVPVYAIGAGTTSKQTDAYVLDLSCARSNPEEIKAHVGSLGRINGTITTTLHIDGKKIATRAVDPAPKTEVSFPIPELAEDWHEFAVSVEVDNDELTDRNNLRLGAFRTHSPDKILFLYAAPKLENRHVVRFLRQLYPDLIDVSSVFDPKVGDFDPEDYFLIILGDISRKSVPGKIAAALREQKTAFMFLAGDQLKDWTSTTQRSFPVKRYIRSRNLSRESKPAGEIIRDPANRHPSFRRVPFEALRLRTFEEAELADNAQRILSIQIGDVLQPLVVADKYVRPKLVVLLSQTTWRWGLAPEARARSGYNAFWRRILNWIMGVKANQHELQLQILENATNADETVINVLHQNRDMTERLRKVVVLQNPANDANTLKCRDVKRNWRCNMPNPDDRPSIVWVQGRAEFEGNQLTSDRRPIVYNVNSQELFETQPHPETLQELVDEPSRFAESADAESVLTQAFAGLSKDAPQKIVRQRNWRKELILAALVLLLVSSEWLVERTLKERAN